MGYSCYKVSQNPRKLSTVSAVEKRTVKHFFYETPLMYANTRFAFYKPRLGQADYDGHYPAGEAVPVGAASHQVSILFDSFKAGPASGISRFVRSLHFFF